MAGSAIVQEDEILGKAYDSRLMRRVLTYLRPYKRQVLVALVVISSRHGGDGPGRALPDQAGD